MDDSHPLWRFFRDIRVAVDVANRGGSAQPYASGTFMVSALEGDVELTISDVSEEDAVLIASELSELGVKAVIRSSLVCPECGRRVPQQEHCVHCRAKLPRVERP